ncbi:MAG: BamA/TamA family outer membrane protein [Verrucomicrobiaceae bacterium]|nr:BamA/TamA family outer membrane protein [Verrucomicrobiaceae bacterium]
MQGQASPSPLINTEQIAAGGISTVRGYLVATQLGDGGIIGSMELRTPALSETARDKNNEWRAYAFADATTALRQCHPAGEERTQSLASIGIGSRLRWKEHYFGSLDIGMPLITQPNSIAQHLNMTFRLGADF